MTTDRKSTRLNSSHSQISYAVFCLKKNNDPPHFWQARFHLQYFVSLFLILAEHIVRVRKVHHVGELLGQAMLIHPVVNAVDTLGAERRIEQLRPVVADDRQEFLPLES